MLWMILALCSIGEPSKTDLNVVIVLDASGSMDRSMPSGENKMVVAKQVLKSVLADILQTGSLQIGIVVFGNVRDEWVYSFGPPTPALLSSIDSIEASGGTPLGTFMKKGADVLLEQREKQKGYGISRLLIITDGETEGSETKKMNKYMDDILTRGIEVDVIGVAMANDHSLKTKVGSDHYFRANDAKSFASSVKTVFAEVNAKDGRNLDEDFALLDFFQTEQVPKVINALSPSNHPIGEKKPSKNNDKASSANPNLSDVDVSCLVKTGCGALLAVGCVCVAVIIRSR
jgi:uncharacterized protein YegL